MEPELAARTIDSLGVGVERRAWGQRLKVAGWTLGVGWMMGGCVLLGTLGTWAVLGVPAVSLACFVAAAVLKWLDRPRPGRLVVSPDGLAVEREGYRARTPWSEVKGGAVVPGYDRSYLEIERANGDVLRVQMPSPREGYVQLALMGLDVRRRVLNVSFGPRWHRVAFFVLSTFAALALTSSAGCCLGMFRDELWTARPLAYALWIAATVALGLLGTVLWGPPLVTLGADGLGVRSRGRRRFFRYEDIHRIDVVAKGCRIVLMSGEVIDLQTTDASNEPPLTVYGCVVDARTHTREQLHHMATLALLERGARSFDEWRERLRAVLAPSGGVFRGLAVTPEDLLRVAEDPTASHEQRLGAVMALAPRDNPAALTRVRVVIDACANEALRDALEAAAAGTLDAATTGTGHARRVVGVNVPVPGDSDRPWTRARRAWSARSLRCRRDVPTDALAPRVSCRTPGFTRACAAPCGTRARPRSGATRPWPRRCA